VVVVGLALAIVVGLSMALLLHRYVRMVSLADLSIPQTVAIGFQPVHMHWRVSGNVDGSGTLMIHSFSNRVSGAFSVKGGGDYYDSTASLKFVPDVKSKGKIRAWMLFTTIP
jgi:hypothetical protein